MRCFIVYDTVYNLLLGIAETGNFKHYVSAEDEGNGKRIVWLTNLTYCPVFCLVYILPIVRQLLLL